jgi:thiol-disulfide isomerase/thioredoxin
MIQIRALARGIAGVAVGALVLTACSGDQTGDSGNGTNFVTGTGQITVVAAGDRDQAPDLSGETLEGEPVSLSDYRGQIVVLNVWGSWCAPCRAEAPHLVTVAEEMAPEGVQFLGINTRDASKETALAFERTFEVEYPSLWDPDGRLLLEFPDGTLNPQLIPSTLVIDREGRIAARALTDLGEDELRDLVRSVLDDDAAAS